MKLQITSLLILFQMFLYADESALKLMQEAQEEIESLTTRSKTKCVLPTTDEAIAKENITEVTKQRKVSSFIQSCFEARKIIIPDNFGKSMDFAIAANTSPSKNTLSSYISETYNTKDWKQDVSLYSQPMCETVDHKLIARGNSTKNTRINKVKNKIIKISKEFNRLRSLFLKAVSDKEADEVIAVKKKDLDHYYKKLMIIIANHESLTTADSSTSIKRAKQFAKYYKVKNYEKPSGVKFYYDKAQSSENSKRNVGLYQFPMSGNVIPCVTAWNAMYGDSQKCKITDTSKKNMFLLLTAPDQAFNSFCGVNKLVQSIGVQVNSNKYEVYGGKARRTHQDNIIQSGSKKGKLKEPKNRCISLFTHTSNTYNHYGTLGFTTSNNTIDLINKFTSALNLE